MIRRVFAWFAARFGPDEEPDAEGERGEFVPSPLDQSVRYAHGGGDGGRRELTEIRERAETLEERHRDE